jgi:hypothetical protein
MPASIACRCCTTIALYASCNVLLWHHLPLQTRLPYGFEYNGAPIEGVPFVLPACNPGLMAAVNALQTSPVVTLSLASTQVHAEAGLVEQCI